MKKPLIGINCKVFEEDGDTYLKLDRNYVRSVERAGGRPCLMPLFRTPAEARGFLELVDGIVLTGGPDIDPRRYGQRKHPKSELIHPDRERSDFLALREALRQDTPTLAICCGHQELNVALGGTLHQHIYDLPGVRDHSKGSRHRVEVRPGTRIREILGVPRTEVYSWHHQACDRLGKGLVQTAQSPDGLVEGIEGPRHRFLVGVQWHPERMQTDPRHQRIFRALVSEARR